MSSSSPRPKKQSLIKFVLFKFVIKEMYAATK
jgi:hypothetical protein